jgi:ankyrin repeat protein
MLVADQQGAGLNITFMALPAEVLAYIMYKVDNPIMLSMACRTLHALYQEVLVYEPHERQVHKLIYSLPNLNITALREKLARLSTDRECRVVIPEVDTPEWLQLKYNRQYVRGPLDMVKDTYMMAWELLLHPRAIHNQAYASELMRLILELVHYVDANQYVAQLFAGNFPQDFFAQLADVHLDRCLRIVANYFPIEKNSPAYAFFLQQSPLIDRVGYYFYYDKAQPSLLFFVIEKLIPSGMFEEDQEKLKIYAALLQLLLTRGCDLEQSNEQGETALLYMLRLASKLISRNSCGKSLVTERLFELVNLLLEKGANCSATTKQGDNILSYAIQTYCLTLIKHLLCLAQLDEQLIKEHKVSALFLAIAADDLTMVKALLGQFTLYDDIRICAFLYTLWCKKDDMAEEMADAFLGNITAEERYHFVNRALKYTIEHCLPEEFGKLVLLLLQYGANCNMADRVDGTTALMQACAYQQEELVKLLLQQPGIQLNIADQCGKAALHYAIDAGSLSIIQALLVINKLSLSNLHIAFNYALEEGQDEVAGMLSATVEDDVSAFIAEALNLALSKGQQEIVALLTSWQKRLMIIK